MHTKLNFNLVNKRRVVLHIVLLTPLIYFVFHAVIGNRGILAYFNLSQQLEKAVTYLDHLRSERLDVEHKVRLLKAPIDLDMLDEQARKVLGVAKPTEQVFVQGER